MTAYYNDRLAEILRDWSEDDLRGAARLVGHLADRLADHKQWRVQHVGSNDGLPDGLVTTLADAAARSAGHTGLHINLAVGYGGRREIADAMRSIVRAHGEGGDPAVEAAVRERVHALCARFPIYQ